MLWAGSQDAFVCLCGSLCLWTLCWGRSGCSVLWVQVLRLGVGAAPILGRLLGVKGLLMSSSILIAALLVGLVSYYRRLQDMKDAEIPAALQKLSNVQGRLGLW